MSEENGSQEAPADATDERPSEPATGNTEPGAEAEGATQAAADSPDEDIHWAVRMREFVDEAARIAREDLADKEITFEDTKQRAEELIRKQPLTAVGLAAGVGLLAGVLINRRR